MICKYKVYIDKLISGKLNEGEETQLKEHAKECLSCAIQLKQIKNSDELIKGILHNAPNISKRYEIMEKIQTMNTNFNISQRLYSFRKLIYALSAVLILIISINTVNPIFNILKSAYEEQNNTSAAIKAIKITKHDNDFFTSFPDKPGILNTIIAGGGPAPGIKVPCQLETQVKHDKANSYTVTFIESWNKKYFNPENSNEDLLKHYWEFEIVGDKDTLVREYGEPVIIQAIK